MRPVDARVRPRERMQGGPGNAVGVLLLDAYTVTQAARLLS